ncbi:MAG: Fic family protein [Prevotella sp.]|jgi:Fic family protein|nr:Fic family protein [Prevotella sp.]MCI1281898.1 Fic family protein [Prevotella sp.]
MFIHEREKWTDFRWDANQLIDVLSQVNRETGFLAGRLSAIGFDAQLSTTAQTIANDIVASSAIEGVILDSSEVRSSVARKLGIKVNDEKASTHYVDGIVEMMLDATANYLEPLSEKRLFSWHGALFPTGRSGLSEIHVGAYRTDPMQVVSGMFGREKVHYRAPEAEKVPAEMKTFIDWFNDKDIKPSYIKSAVAHFWFVSIHPFDDGNGRIARAISDMILAQAESNGQRFYSVSYEINKEKSAYYDVLERTQHGDGDLTEWLAWYLKCIGNAVMESYTMLSGVLRKSIFWRLHSQSPMSEREKNVLNAYIDGYDAKLTIKNYAKLCRISTDTAARDIHDLEDKGVLRMAQGRVRDASYSLVYSHEKLQYENLAATEHDGRHYISATFPDHRTIEERISDIDWLRFSQKEVTLQDLADTYFAFLNMG